MGTTAMQVLQMGFSLDGSFLVVLLLTCSRTFIHPILNSAKILSKESETIYKK